MTQAQTNEIRELVKKGGWSAVRSHPTLSKVWSDHSKQQKKYTDWICAKF